MNGKKEEIKISKPWFIACGLMVIVIAIIFTVGMVIRAYHEELERVAFVLELEEGTDEEAVVRVLNYLDIVPEYIIFSGESESRSYGVNKADKRIVSVNREKAFSFEELSWALLEFDKIEYFSTGEPRILAQLLEKPDVTAKLDVIHLVGGGVFEYDGPHETEHRFAKLPEAAKTIFASDIDVILFPLDFVNHRLQEGEQMDENVLCAALSLMYHQDPARFRSKEMKLICDEYGHIFEDEHGRKVQIATDMDRTLIRKLREAIF